jgi:D-sedoheptulose 7-phosphate isomerase
LENRDKLEKIFTDHAALVQDTREQCAQSIVAAGDAIIRALAEGNTVFACGNGGSAADAQHFTAELVGRFVSKNRRPLPAVALTTDSSALTSIGNDFGYQQIFARQVEALARPGDILVGISTSGRSANVMAAFEKAHALGVTCIGLAGADGSAMAAYCSQVVAIPHPETARIQEMHITVIHAWCAMVDGVFGD